MVADLIKIYKILENKGEEMEKDRFSIKDSEKLKGIAIILMLMHHLFLDRSVFESYGVIFKMVTSDRIRNISWFGKECVAIFAFISAYGITKSYLKDKKNRGWFVNRAFKLYKGFWFIYILALVISILTNRIPYRCGNPFLTTVYAVIDFFGLNNIFGSPSLNGAWWYMEIALEIIVLIPILDKIYDKIGCAATLILALVLPKILGVNYLGLPANGNNSFVAFFMIIVLGVACAKYNLMERVITYIESGSLWKKICFFLINTLFLYFGYHLFIALPVNQFYDINYGLVAFVLIIWLRLYVINIPVVSQILSILGKHSMNIYLVHIFIRSTYAQDFTYGFRYWELILLFLLTSSLIISIVIERIKRVIRYDYTMDKLCEAIQNNGN